MTPPVPLLGALGVAAALAGSVLVLTWTLGHAMPHPYSGLLAAVLTGLGATEVWKRRPPQRALRLLRQYLRRRERGTSEVEAKRWLLARACHDRAAAAEVEAQWSGASEKERVVAGVHALLARIGVSLDRARLDALYDRARDRVIIAEWEALPKTFVDEVRAHLDAPERDQLATLTERYGLLRQKFFESPSALGADPPAAAAQFARLLHSLGNRLAAEQPADAERAYRLSLRLRPAHNLAHAGLALLLDRTGRSREAVGEARAGLAVLDEYARAGARNEVSVEDISPFRSPARLREALDRIVGRG